MAKKKKKYYVVWDGNEPGIYETWGETQLQIKGYPNAKYKSFKTLEEAEAAYHGNYEDNISRGNKKKSITTMDHAFNPDIIKDSISVDAACSGNPGKMEYQGVMTISGQQLFHVGPLEGGTNNIGEFLALVHAMAALERKSDDKTVIYTDSRTAMAWIRNKKVKTTLKRTRYNHKVFELIERAIKWLEKHKHRNPIVKWKTSEWGEIPADFGRK
ncbi:MAG: ribonuclease H [Saprospiraceae bacterium]|nr:ribonuclease H [Saprospiraceae bacterium]